MPIETFIDAHNVDLYVYAQIPYRPHIMKLNTCTLSIGKSILVISWQSIIPLQYNQVQIHLRASNFPDYGCGSSGMLNISE